MENRSLVTIANHSKERILYLLEMAREFEKKPNFYWTFWLWAEEDRTC